MTTEAGSGIDTTFNPVAGKIIPSVLYTAVVLGLVFQRRFEFDAGGVAIAAKTLIMTKGADGLVLVCHHAMGIGKYGRVIVAFKIKRFFFESMAFCAELPSLSQFKKLGMDRGQSVAVLCCACDQQQ